MSDHKKMPDDVLAALEFLIQIAEKHNAVVAGFMFSSKEPHFMTNFGNCTDCGDPVFYARLCAIAEEKRAVGMSYHQRVGRTQ
jgi:hypothetical protein